MGVSHTLWPHSITRATLACLWFAQGLHKAPKIKTAEPLLRDCGLHRASRQIKTTSKGIVRKECQSFTNHGHDKPPPTVFNPLSLWLTLPRDMGVSHTLWPPSITRAILACLWFAQGLHKVCTGFAQDTKNQNSRAILARLWFAQGLHRVCTGHQKSKQQINSHCCQLHLQGLHVYGAEKLPFASLPLTEVSAWHMFFQKRLFQVDL